MSVEFIRVLIGDRVKKAVNEIVGEADGSNLRFQLDMFPMVSGATAALVLLETGVAATTANVTISGGVGGITYSNGNAPAAGATLLATYKYHTLTSGEISDILSGHTGEPYLAAANACLAIAGDSSRLFAYTLGDKMVDKKQVARRLLDLSAMLETRHYRVRDDGAFDAKIFTMKDNSGTPYVSYDSAVAFLTTS